MARRAQVRAGAVWHSRRLTRRLGLAIADKRAQGIVVGIIVRLVLVSDRLSVVCDELVGRQDQLVTSGTGVLLLGVSGMLTDTIVGFVRRVDVVEAQAKPEKFKHLFSVVFWWSGFWNPVNIPDSVSPGFKIGSRVKLLFYLFGEFLPTLSITSEVDLLSCFERKRPCRSSSPWCWWLDHLYCCLSYGLASMWVLSKWREWRELRMRLDVGRGRRLSGI